MSSVAQVVRKIIDDLTDGVSELVLLVVVLAEQCQAVPDQLPSAATVVNSTANTLAEIARKLGKTDYAEFPEISSEIVEASDAVEHATKSLDHAIRVLESGQGDLRTGWNSLVDACRIMSGKTIRLLQIVYGAELKKLQLSADKLMNDIDKMDLNRNLRNKGDQGRFVGDMGDVTAKALKMANQLNARATDPNISPFSQDMLRKAAQNLKDKAQQLIDAGNDALRDPTMLPKVQAALDNLKKEIQNAKAVATQVAPEDPALENLKKLLPLIECAAQKTTALPEALKNPAKYERAEKEAKEAVQELAKALKPKIQKR